MSFNVDLSVDTNPIAIQALIDKIENDERLRNIVIAAADSNPQLLEALKEKMKEPEPEKPMISARVRRKRVNGWDAGAIIAYEQAVKQRHLVASILESVKEWANIRSNALKSNAALAATAQSENPNRIYVGSLDFQIPEAYVAQLFQGFGHIVSLNMPKDPNNPMLSRGYCFIEFDNKESADRALAAMHGFVVSGRPIKVSLPTIGAAATPGSSLVSDNLGPNPNARLFFANVPQEVDENQMRTIFESFGALRGIQMIRPPGSTTHKGYGFLEYYDEECASVALASMQEFPLGARTLQVKRAQTRAGPDPATDPYARVNAAQQAQARMAAANISGLGSMGSSSDRLGDVQVATQGERVELMRRLEATRGADMVVLVLHDIFSPQDFQEAPEDALRDEIAEECRNYGPISEILLRRTPTGFGTAYIKYTDAMSALTGRDKLNGRFFAGRRISAEVRSSMDVVHV